ncbi:MAG: DUF3987 domain-containing protein [Tepidimonas sp.]|uniref:DUF3987 domain-containing protein n=1 Tax=Tepidimonas sp. TaxID=2002775 RepID=UPI00298F07F8|nr:DUF3987 domain-containing protein [Tepidimonas sp.]MCS6811928.1 DUF3987 domain-containing protein [Tepidimonas sp.]MDW8337439.1 DUF3987 domain-containing protein [Tepidimonas sp.]
MNPPEDFARAIAAAGLTPPPELIGDGKLHRFSSNGSRGDDAGWYVLYSDGIPAGAFGCWRQGIAQQWTAAAPDRMTEAERSAHRARMEAIRKERQRAEAERQREAAAEASRRWAEARPADAAHPYLAAKAIGPHGIRQEGGALLVPMRDTAGTLHSLQAIDAGGGKRFHPGGRIRGCYHAIGTPNGALVVCEGYATGASIHEATGYAVAVAFTAGNLLPVAEALRAKYPALRLIVAADDDWRTEGNPGLTKARQAAQAIGAALAVPRFPEDRPDKATDFNDLAKLRGHDAVRACIEAADTTGPLLDEWPQPEPLPEDLPPVEPFSPELLPEALRGWITDIAERMQCPPDFPAVGAIVALSGLVGARVVAAPKQRDDWRVTPNLWGLIVGNPGVMKSPALGQVLKPLEALQSRARERWQAEHEAWQQECRLIELAERANEKQAAALAAKDRDRARALLTKEVRPSEPTMRRYLVNDSTVEKLAELLAVNPWGLLAYRDELHGLIASMDRPGQEGARGFYLSAYDGDKGYAVDRIGRGETYIPRVCLAMLGSIQPGVLQGYVREATRGGAGSDGLLQRFSMAVWPDVSPHYRLIDRWPDNAARQAAREVFERLDALQPSGDGPHALGFSPEAQGTYAEWAVPFEAELRRAELHPALVAHLAKYRKLVPALALLFALIDRPDAGRIERNDLLRALAWSDYLRSHAERIYAAAVIPETASARLLLERIRAGRIDGPDFTPRQVAVKHWAGLATPEDVRKAADLLVEYGWLRRETSSPGAGGGRPSDRYLIHPMLSARG